MFRRLSLICCAFALTAASGYAGLLCAGSFGFD